MEQITLKKARTNIGLTIEEVSEITGIDKDLLIELEKDSSEIEFNTLKELVKLYQTSVDDIFLGKTVSDDFKFNIFRSKHLTEAIMDYVTEINDVRQRVFC